jgi:hypothetical protein
VSWSASPGMAQPNRQASTSGMGGGQPPRGPPQHGRQASVTTLVSEAQSQKSAKVLAAMEKQITDSIDKDFFAEETKFRCGTLSTARLVGSIVVDGLGGLAVAGRSCT